MRGGNSPGGLRQDLAFSRANTYSVTLLAHFGHDERTEGDFTMHRSLPPKLDSISSMEPLS